MEEAKKTGICREFILIMQASLDGTAPLEEEKALESHLEHCEDCRKLYRELKLIRNAVASAAAEPPADLSERVMARLQEENRSLSVEKVRKSKNRKRIMGFALGAAALLALAFVGIDKLGLLHMTGRMAADVVAEESYAEASAVNESKEASLPAENADGIVADHTSAEEYNSKGASYPADYRSEMESEEAGTGYRGEEIARVVGMIIKAAGVTGRYGEVIYAAVENLPEIKPLTTSYGGACAFYSISDFAGFITSQKLVLSDIQYELTEEEIRNCGLDFGGSRILLVLDTSYRF